MKEIKLATKNNLFGEVEYNCLRDKINDKVLPLLKLVVMKRNYGAKSGGCARGSYQRVRAGKSEVPSLNPGFYSLNYRR